MYNFAAQGYSPSTGHFTQMVWRSTQRIGCGVQPRCSGGNFLVCHYDPPGGAVEAPAIMLGPGTGSSRDTRWPMPACWPA